MKKKIIISSLAVLTLVSLTIAQGLKKKEYKEPIERLLILKFDPVQLIDPLQSIQFSFEKQSGAHGSYQVGLGYIFRDYFYKQNDTKLDKDAANLKLRAEYRLYCKNIKHNKASWFFAPQFFYSQAYFKNKSSGAYKDPYTNNNVEYLNNYSVRRQAYGLYTKTGFQKFRRNGFVFELYFGPGIEYVNSKTTGIKHDFYSNNNNNYDRNLRDITDLSLDLKEFQSEVKMCFTLGISLGWSFSNIVEMK